MHTWGTRGDLTIEECALLSVRGGPALLGLIVSITSFSMMSFIQSMLQQALRTQEVLGKLKSVLILNGNKVLQVGCRIYWKRKHYQVLTPVRL